MSRCRRSWSSSPARGPPTSCASALPRGGPEGSCRRASSRWTRWSTRSSRRARPGQGRSCRRPRRSTRWRCCTRSSRRRRRPWAARRSWTLDSFLPLGLKIHRDVEELAIERVPPRRVAEAQPLIEEEIPARSRERLLALSRFCERFYPSLAERNLSTRSSRYVEVASRIEPDDLGSFGLLLFAGFSTLTRAEQELFARVGGLAPDPAHLPGRPRHARDPGRAGDPPPRRARAAAPRGGSDPGCSSSTAPTRTGRSSP